MSKKGYEWIIAAFSDERKDSLGCTMTKTWQRSYG